MTKKEIMKIYNKYDDLLKSKQNFLISSNKLKENIIIDFVKELGVKVEEELQLKKCPLCNDNVKLKDESQVIQEEIVEQWSIICECGLTLTRYDKKDLIALWNGFNMR